MRELLLIPVVLAAFVFCYFVMAGVDRFVEDSQRLITDGNRDGRSKVRIAAENPALLEAVGTALEQCSRAGPHLEFFLSSGSRERILGKLMAEQVDIALLADPDRAETEEQYSSLRIPGSRAAGQVRVLGLPVEDLDGEHCIRVMWKRDLSSKDRDRVIFALENEFCGQNVCWADYLE